MSPEAWGITLYLGVGPICLGGVLSMFALRVLSTSRAAQMMLLVPPIASLIAWLWLGEIPKDEVFWGGGLILLGVFLGGINRWVARSEPALEPNAPAAGVLDC
jgi:drug/metabolite transporter (DMT)-like permease